MKLLADVVGVPKSQLWATNSRGVLWVSDDGIEGNFKNGQQLEFARRGKLDWDMTVLTNIIEHVRPAILVGATGKSPGCFDQQVIETMVRVNEGQRPGIFALSNPMTKADVTAADAIAWSRGVVIYGSGTAFLSFQYEGRSIEPGQVNNVYVFPGVSFGAICCEAETVPEGFFMVAAEAVAKSLTQAELEVDRCMPHPDRLREVSLNVATAVVLEAQRKGVAGRILGSDEETVKAALQAKMWSPSRKFSSAKE